MMLGVVLSLAHGQIYLLPWVAIGFSKISRSM